MFSVSYKKIYIIPQKFDRIDLLIKYLKSLFDNCTIYCYKQHLVIVPDIICHYTLMLLTDRRHLDHLSYMPNDAFTIVDGKARAHENICLLCNNYARHIAGECNKSFGMFKIHESEKGKHEFKEKRKVRKLLNIHPRFIFDKDSTAVEDADYYHKSIIKKIKEYNNKIQKKLIKHQTKLEDKTTKSKEEL